MSLQLARVRFPLAAVCAAGTIGSIPAWLIPLDIGAYVDAFGQSLEFSGLIATVEFTGLGLILLGIAPIISNLSPRTLALSGILISIAANLLTLAAPSGTALLFIRMIAGISAGMVYATMTSLVARGTDQERRYAIVCIIATAVSAMAMFSLAYVIPIFGQKVIFVVQALIQLLALPILATLPQKSSVVASSIGLVARVRGQRGLWLITSNFLLWVSSGAIWSLSERLGLQIDYSVAEMAIILSVSSVGGLAGAMLAAWIGPRWGQWLPLSIGLGIFASASFVTAMTGNHALFVGALTLANVAVMFNLPFMFALGARVDPQGRVATAIGSTTTLGQSIAPIIAVNIAAVSTISAVGYLVLISTFIAFILMSIQSRTSRPRRDGEQQGTI